MKIELINSALLFFKSVPGDNILFIDEYYRNDFTDFESKILEINSTYYELHVELPELLVNSTFGNKIFISWDKLYSIYNVGNSIDESELDGKIISLNGFIEKFESKFNDAELKKLQTLRDRMKWFYSKVISANEQNGDLIGKKIDMGLYCGLFTDLD